MRWRGRRVLVTGGASFIGSALVDQLVRLGADVLVVDDLSTGALANIEPHLLSGAATFVQGDLRDSDVAAAAVKGISVVFHLAANHGGRGYIDLHQAATAGNLALDGTVLLACRNAGVEKVVYASSGCVYPRHAQTDPGAVVYLSEESVGPPYDPDNLYGYAKLAGELTLEAYCKEWGLKGASCRYFTVYGERATEDHAVIAMIARAFVGQNPYQVWGTGEQVRNWTHVSDIVAGTILAAEKIEDGSAVNLGTMERTRVIDAVREIFRYTGCDPQLELQPDAPTGPLNRVADNARARELLGWEPAVPFIAGLHSTIDWYFKHKDPEQVRLILARGGLVERSVTVTPPTELSAAPTL